MQHHLSTIKIPSKPHVAQYIRAKYLEEDATIHIRTENIILNLIASCSTQHYNERAIYNDDFETVDVLLPKRYQHLYVSSDKVKTLVIALEKHFWMQAQLYIYNIITNPNLLATKEDAIDAFYKEYYLKESVYPVGNFRRMLTRKEVCGTQHQLPVIERITSYRLSNQQCKQIARLHTQKKIPLRTIAQHYNISHEGARKIIKKIFTNSVLKVDNKLTVI
jgi:hypothetical protein